MCNLVNIIRYNSYNMITCYSMFGNGGYNHVYTRVNTTGIHHYI